VDAVYVSSVLPGISYSICLRPSQSLAFFYVSARGLQQVAALAVFPTALTIPPLHEMRSGGSLFGLGGEVLTFLAGFPPFLL